MGYRNYFYKLNKEKYNKIKDMKWEDFLKEYREDPEDDYVFLPHIMDEEIFEFGKLYYDDTIDRIEKMGVPFSSNKEVMDHLADHEPYVISKEGFKETINIYREKIQDIYKVFVKEPERLEDKNYKIKHLGFIKLKEIDELTEEEKKELLENERDYAFWWFNGGNDLLNLNPKSNILTSSWLYEHAIFNLINEYKHFDFDKNVLVFMGW